MGLTVCPDCASDVSDQAPRCPKCGRTMAAAYAKRGWSPLILPGLFLAAPGAILFFLFTEQLGFVAMIGGLLAGLAGVTMVFVGLIANLRSP